MRKKVIEGLKHEINRADVPIYGTDFIDCVEVALLRDALALLEDQEKQSEHTHKHKNYEDWSGAQGNCTERIIEQAQRSEWGVYG